MRAVLTFENGATTIADVWLKPNSGGAVRGEHRT